MADEDVNEDHWLYGDSNPDKSNDAPAEDNLYGDKFENSLDSNAANQPPGVLEPPIIEPPGVSNIIENIKKDPLSDQPPGVDDKDKNGVGEEDEEEGEDGEVRDGSKDDEEPVTRTNQDEDDDDDDDSEDDVNVVIGEIKTSSQYTIKRGGLLTAGPQLKQPGKFSIEEFETIGAINGVPAHDFSLDSVEDKPWRKPGADITDYFNYGFNEETWRSYCERQKRMRVQESGVGLAQLSGNIAPQTMNQGGVGRGSIPVTIVNDNSKYSAPGSVVPTAIMRKAGPPPGRRVAGTIDVLGNSNLNQLRGESPPKGNIIQVMTADRREYSRKTGFPDMSIPPPMIPPGIPPPIFDGGPYVLFNTDYIGEYYNSDMDPYYQTYEPTQDSQWANSGWDQEDIKVMPLSYPPPPTVPAHLLTSETSNQDSQDTTDKSNSGLPGGITIKQERDSSKDRERDRERERADRDRDRLERHRERSHRHRSRSRSTERRSRKHKSHSRSPGHRSHKKKKSKKADRAKEESD